jgi:hypothetical protein
MLTAWLIRLEAAHCFGGPRRYLHDLLGTEVAGFLERAGVLRQSAIAPSYPCEERRGDHCPRTVVEIDGAYHAVCGNRPAGCRDLILTEHEAALLCIDVPGLCRILASALGIRARPESIRDLIGIHLVGFFMPEPGIRYPVYLVARSSAQSYADAFGALVTRQDGRPFFALVPTGRFLTDNLEGQMRSNGAVLIALAPTSWS